MLVAIAADDASTFTVALARDEPAGAFANSAAAILPEEIASVSCKARESAKLLASAEAEGVTDIPNEMLVELAVTRRPAYAPAAMLLIWS